MVKSTRGKCDIESAKLGFEVLVSKLREVEAAAKDASYNARKRISTLEAENEALAGRITDHINSAHDERKALLAERDQLRAALEAWDNAYRGNLNPSQVKQVARLARAALAKGES